MITVHATRIQNIPYPLEKIKIRKESMEIMQDLGTYACKASTTDFHVAKGTIFDGPICRVVMTSGRVLYINATSEELEARSA